MDEQGQGYLGLMKDCHQEDNFRAISVRLLDKSDLGALSHSGPALGEPPPENRVVISHLRITLQAREGAKWRLLCAKQIHHRQA